MWQVPILRGGTPYESKETLPLVDYADGTAVAEVSQANPGLISRDLGDDAWGRLQEISVAELLAPNDVVLVKGSRGARMERLVEPIREAFSD